MKKYIAFIATIIVLSGGAFYTQQWFTKTSIAENSSHAAQESFSFTATSTGTVLDLMKALSTEGSLHFSGREFPSLGFFVEEINGKKNSDGYYWFLYVNGTSSQTGASQTTLSAGDRVEWKYEKEY